MLHTQLAAHTVVFCTAAACFTMQLITRYFTQAGAKKGATKRPQALLVPADASNASLWASHMNHMLRPLRGHPWEQGMARF
jgi:NO-binding membrane sensor protein with MHYT domain